MEKSKVAFPFAFFISSLLVSFSSKTFSVALFLSIPGVGGINRFSRSFPGSWKEFSRSFPGAVRIPNFPKRGCEQTNPYERLDIFKGR